jgi:hypothetical protein
LHTLHSNLTNGYIIGKYRSSSNLVIVRWFLAELCSLIKFSVSVTLVYFTLKFDIWIHQRNAQVKFEFGHGSMIFGRVMPLSLWENKKFSVSIRYLFNGSIHSTQIWHMDTSKEWEGQDPILWYCIPRKDFAHFKLAVFAVGMIPRIFIAANMSLITYPRTFLASTKYNIKSAEYL